nr:hypothetical protein [Geobacter hydrogenophilus]
MKAIFLILLISYGAVVVPFTDYLRNRPVAVKLGYTPDARILKIASADHCSLVAQLAIVKVLFYYGTIVEKFTKKIDLPVEHHNMFKTVNTALKLDPYNMDAYYFTQAAFTWEVGRVREVNAVLDYGMKYRTWDYYLPFFAGFNSAYFLKDYRKAAQYMKNAAELSGDPLFTKLAARYFYESGQNQLGILFLETMRKGSKDKKIQSMYEIREKALKAVSLLEDAVVRFERERKCRPSDLSELVAANILTEIPVDPYGGKFYLAEDGKVRTTSKFAFGGKEK